MKQNKEIYFIPEIWKNILEYLEYLALLSNPQYSLTGLDELTREFTSQSLNIIFKKIGNRNKAAIIYARLPPMQKKERDWQLHEAMNSLKGIDKQLAHIFVERMLINIPLTEKFGTVFKALCEESKYKIDFFIDTLQRFTELKPDQILENLLINFTYLSIQKKILKTMPITNLHDPTFARYELISEKPWGDAILFFAGSIATGVLTWQNFDSLVSLTWWSGLKDTALLTLNLVCIFGCVDILPKLFANQPVSAHKLLVQRIEHFFVVKRNLAVNKNNNSESTLGLSSS